MPYQEPDYNQALQDPQYLQGLDILNQQQQADTADINQQISGLDLSYAGRRASTIRGYQDALDSINNSLRETGINVRSNYAGRNLYNASGDVSGIGQGYAAGELNPIYQSLNRNASNQAADLTALDAQKASDLGGLQTKLSGLGATYQGKKYDLAQNIFSGIKDAAYRRYQITQDEDNKNYQRSQDAAQAQAQASKDPMSKDYNLAMGRQYISTPAELNKLAKQYGKDALVLVGGRWYVKSPEERLAIQKDLASIDATNRSNREGTGKTTTPTSSYGAVSKVRDPNGGFAFTRYNKATKKSEPVGLAVYALSKGLPIDTVLADSDNPSDRALIQEIAAARAHGDDDETILREMLESGQYNHLFVGLQ